MDDFLGTSIQYSEKELIKLEEEYAIQKAKEVEELINSGFLDTDYESSTSQYIDSEDDIENETKSDNISLTAESKSDLSMDYESSSSTLTSTEYKIESPSSSSSSLTSSTSSILNLNRNNSALVLSADISKMNKYLRYGILLFYVIKDKDDQNNDKRFDEQLRIICQDENEEIEEEIYEKDELNQTTQQQNNSSNNKQIHYKLQIRASKEQKDIIDGEEHEHLSGFIDFILGGDIKLFILGVVMAVIIASTHNPSPSHHDDQLNNPVDCNSNINHQGHTLWLLKYINNNNNNAQRIYFKQPSQENLNENQKEFASFDVALNIEKNDLLHNNNNNDGCNKMPMQLKVDQHLRWKLKVPAPNPIIIQFGIGLRNIKIPQFKSYHRHKDTIQDPVGSRFERKVMKFGLGALFMGIAWFAASAAAGDEIF